MSEDNKPLKIFIGWDSREDIAYQVARFSILEHASVPVEIIPLKQKKLKKDGFYWREIDTLAATEFTYTRYLIPELCNFEGWALFVDCDFVFLEDVKNLFSNINDRYAIMCAQHEYTPKEGVKMDGKKQTVYPRKNWSSMMLINCEHPSNRILTKEIVNDPGKTGAYFHRFSWLADHEIGSLSHEWNWLVGWYNEPKDGLPRALHYTEGGPWFPQYENCEYAVEWYKVNYKYQNNLIKNYENKLKNIDVDDLSYDDQKKNLIKDFLRTTVDPDQNYFKINLNESVKNVMGEKVAAIDSVGGINYEKKGLNYDSFLVSFILGSEGYISSWENEKDKDTALVIRGLGGGSQKAIRHCWKTGRTFYAIDTGYMGNNKSKVYHRITKNALQLTGPIIKRPTDRLALLNYQFNKFTPGRKILICPPSEKVMNLWNQPSPEEWTNNIVEELKKYTDRPVEIRLKPTRSERISTNTIESALADDVHCLITYNSIAATEALLYGKPAIALGPNAASVLCNRSLKEVERLRIPTKDEMIAFAAHLSYGQFTELEMRSGYAWRIINESS